MNSIINILQKIAVTNNEEEEESFPYPVSPEAALIPAGIMAGGTLGTVKKKPVSSFLRGALTGLGTGTGALLGGYVGKHLTNDSSMALGGGALGALLGYMATREKKAISPVLQQLLNAKGMSDKRDYTSKHRQLRTLLEQHPDDFTIDSVSGNIVGITHIPTSFRIHVPLHVIPSTMLNTKPGEVNEYKAVT
jgi:uncharacterized membrane protein YfcA